MTRLLALDVGKTGCRAALVERGAGAERGVRAEHGALVDHGARMRHGVRVATGEWAGAAGVADRDGVARALDAIAGATDGWPAPDAVGAGLAGLASAPERAAALADGLRARFGPAVRVLLTSDMTTWHAGALGGAPGVVLAAGTGTVALGVADDGRCARVDGWGHLLGDDGSGYAIGRAGLAAALRAHDGRPGGSAALLQLLRERYGDPATLPGRVHGSDNPPREIAAFAPDVLAAADDGNPVATTIVARAATALADAAAAARDRLAGDPAGGPSPVGGPGAARLPGRSGGTDGLRSGGTSDDRPGGAPAGGPEDARVGGAPVRSPSGAAPSGGPRRDGHRVTPGAGTCAVACGGGLLDAGAVLTGHLDAALAARSLSRTRPLGDALDGARLLLEDPTVPHHALLVRPAGGAR